MNKILRYAVALCALTAIAGCAPMASYEKGSDDLGCIGAQKRSDAQARAKGTDPVLLACTRERVNEIRSQMKSSSEKSEVVCTDAFGRVRCKSH